MLDINVDMATSAACMLQYHGLELQNFFSQLGDFLGKHTIFCTSAFCLFLELANLLSLALAELGGSNPIARSKVVPVATAIRGFVGLVRAAFV